MEQSDIKTLKILEALEENPAQSQRDLSRRLKISLGLVNAFTKRLARKGFFKVATIPKNRIQYMLTPRGMTEKARLTYQYFEYSMQYYKNARAEFREIFNQLVHQKKKNVYFHGASELTEIAYITLLETGLKLAGIVDDALAGKQFLNHSILDSSVFGSISAEDAIVDTRVQK